MLLFNYIYPKLIYIYDTKFINPAKDQVRQEKKMCGSGNIFEKIKVGR